MAVAMTVVKLRVNEDIMYGSILNPDSTNHPMLEGNRSSFYTRHLPRWRIVATLMLANWMSNNKDMYIIIDNTISLRLMLTLLSIHITS